jgi:hypothetical protein
MTDDDHELEVATQLELDRIGSHRRRGEETTGDQSGRAQ